MKNVKISNNVIRRMPRYLRKLDELSAQGVERISSNELGRQLGLTPSQIRQDFSCFGEFGQQGYGYNVEYLYEEIGRILGLDQHHHLIIIGAGNLGQALANYMNFEKRGFIMQGIFDVNPKLFGSQVRNLTVEPMELVEQRIREKNIDIAVLTVPKSCAVEVADRLIACGIKAIWNFAHVDLHVPEGVQVENVHLSDSLMKLSYTISCYEKQRG